MKQITFSHPSLDHPCTVRSNILLTTVKVVEEPGHDLVHVWNRGGKAGVLTVDKGDGVKVASLLMDGATVEVLDD